MKRNLLQGIFLISAVALSSCSTLNTISNTKNNGDDVYYTKAKAGDEFEYISQYTQPQNTYVRNDDYYYYGDYESRINRFSYFTPFDYDDDFYYSYTPYNYNQIGVSANIYYNDYSSAYDFGTYSAYDFGYGDFGGYDNFGYGAAYSTYIYSGGGRISHNKSYAHSNNNTGGTGSLVFTRANGGFNRSNGNTSTGAGLTFTRANGGNNGVSGNTDNSTGLSFNRANGNSPIYSGGRPGGSNAVYPGRPGTNSVTPVSTNNTNSNTRIIRPLSENPRPMVQQPTMERASPPSQSNTSSGSSSSGGSGASSGGGGRPVRP